MQFKMCEVMGRSVPEARGQGGPDAGPMAGPPVAGTGGRRRGGAVARGLSRNVVNDAARAPRGSLRAASAPSAAPAKRSPVDADLQYCDVVAYGNVFCVQGGRLYSVDFARGVGLAGLERCFCSLLLHGVGACRRPLRGPAAARPRARPGSRSRRGPQRTARCTLLGGKPWILHAAA